MRWTEIVHNTERDGLPLPTYRLMDTWTRDGLLKAEFKGDRHGRYRDWPDGEVGVALMVARLLKAGITAELAFRVARTQPRDGTRRCVLDDTWNPIVVIEVQGQ